MEPEAAGWTKQEWNPAFYSKQPLVVMRTECVFLCMYCYMRNPNRQEVDLQRKFTDRLFAYSEWVLFRPFAICSRYVLPFV
jgi:hypothetical protein